MTLSWVCLTPATVPRWKPNLLICEPTNPFVRASSSHQLWRRRVVWPTWSNWAFGRNASAVVRLFHNAGFGRGARDAAYGGTPAIHPNLSIQRLRSPLQAHLAQASIGPQPLWKWRLLSATSDTTVGREPHSRLPLLSRHQYNVRNCC